MPEQSHPPYVDGALTIPRQLQRWLDVNPQNGPLRRTRHFITIPSFNINHVWNGYSEVVGEYHFEAPNNLSLILTSPFNTISTNTNYTICVSYVNADNTVVRYSLIRSTSGLIYGTILPYEGQLIKKNFRIEIWNAGAGGVSSDLYDTLIYTSILGNIDYRYGTDSPLVSADQLCLGQQSIGNGYLVPPADGDSGFDVPTFLDPGFSPVPSSVLWTDRNNGKAFVGNGVQVSFASVNRLDMFQNQQYTCATINHPQQLFVQFSYSSLLTSGDPTLLTITDSATFSVVVRPTTNDIVLTINASAVLTVGNLVPDQEYVVAITTTLANGTTLEVYKANGLGFVGFDTNALGIDFGTNRTVTLLSSGNDMSTDVSSRGLLIYMSPCVGLKYTLALQFMSSLISYVTTINQGSPDMMILPLTFGQCAAPTLNI